MFPHSDERGWFILTAIEIAILGGITNWLTSKEHHWFQLLVNIFTAGFVGLLVGEICLHYEFAESWSYFIVGAAGVSAESVLVLFKRCVLIRLEMIVDKDAADHLRTEVYSTQIGELLQERFGVSEQDIELALQRQSLGKMKIGEILVEHGVITEEMLTEALKEQEERNAKGKAKRKKKSE